VSEYIAFVSACVDRKAKEIGEYIESERSHDIYYSRSGYEARKRRTNVEYGSASTGQSTPLPSGRGERDSSRFIDRDDHVLLSARSIAIQKKAPLFRDNPNEEDSFLSPTSAGIMKKFEREKLDLSEIDKLIEADRMERLGMMGTNVYSQSPKERLGRDDRSPSHASPMSYYGSQSPTVDLTRRVSPATHQMDRIVSSASPVGNYRSQSPKIRAAHAVMRRDSSPKYFGS
jgi:hypothetical protein